MRYGIFSMRWSSASRWSASAATETLFTSPPINVLLYGFSWYASLVVWQTIWSWYVHRRLRLLRLVQQVADSNRPTALFWSTAVGICVNGLITSRCFMLIVKREMSRHSPLSTTFSQQFTSRSSTPESHAAHCVTSGIYA